MSQSWNAVWFDEEGEANYELLPEVKFAVKSEKVEKVAKAIASKKRAPAKESGLLAPSRHSEVLQVLDALDGKFKRGDFMRVAKEVLGYEIPFNKKVREVYSKKVGGSYVRSEIVA